MKIKTFIDDNKFRSDLIPGRLGPSIDSQGKISVVNAVEGDERLDHFGVWVIMFDPAGDKEPVVMPCDFGQMLPIIRKIGRNKKVDAKLEIRGTKMRIFIGNEEFIVLLSAFQKNAIRDQFGYI